MFSKSSFFVSSFILYYLTRWSLMWKVCSPHRTLLWEWDGGKVIFTGDKSQKEHFNATNIYRVIRWAICVPLIFRSFPVGLLLGSADNKNLPILHSQQLYISCLLKGWWQNPAKSVYFFSYTIFYFRIQYAFTYNYTSSIEKILGKFINTVKIS